MRKQFKILKSFINYSIALNYSDRTIEGYRRHIKVFFNYLKDELNINDVTKTTREIVLGYQQFLSTKLSHFKKPLSVPTQAAYLGSLKAFFRFLSIHEYIVYDPTTLLELPRREKYLPRHILTKKQINALIMKPDITTLRGYRNRTILEIFYSTGIRSNEMINLNVYDVDIKKGTIFIRMGKGKKDRVVPLTETAAEYIEGYIFNIRKKLLRGNKTDAVIIGNTGKRIDEALLLRIIRGYARKVNIKTANVIGCHTLRHTCATHLLENGAGIRYIQELLGHSSLETTQIYTKVQINNLRKIHARHHPRERF